ncbi:MAG: hypothetical protein WB999_08250 [Candidatus Binataceae bacterium]|jgi:hypothetical protein
MEVLDYTQKEMARRMKTPKFLLVAMALATVLMVAFFCAAPTQAQPSSGNASHQSQIYGAVQTANMAAGNQTRMDDVTILVRKVKEGRLGKVVAFSEIKNGQYAVDMGDLPAGKYVVMVDPGASGYMQGERLIEYPGPGSRKRQNWTISTEQIAIPSLE